MVCQRRALVAAPPFHQVPGVGPVGKDVEGDREGVRGETPAHSLGQAPVGWRATETVLDFLRMTRVGCIGTEIEPPEEDGGESEGEEGGPGPVRLQFFLRLSFVPLSVGAKSSGCVAFVAE